MKMQLTGNQALEFIRSQGRAIGDLSLEEFKELFPPIGGGAQSGKFVMKEATVIVNGTDLSNMVQSVGFDLPDDEVEISGMQDLFKEFA